MASLCDESDWEVSDAESDGEAESKPEPNLL